MLGGDYARPNYPVAWVRAQGNGRVGYNAMGHREDVWDSEYYQSMLLGQLRWVAKKAEADITPNLTQAAPGAGTLQAIPAEVK
jgi:type 1 glutamine amidotransferase